ncbi:MAG: hypothetical protein MJ086_00275 [Lachnospiraceae bacterium]|nr:hypothetical protein [Lachnospiraceae bacterium]
MKKRIQKIIGLFLILLLIMPFALAAGAKNAKAEEIIEIHTYEELLQMAEHPEGSYVLAQDIACGEKEWIPIDFSGTFDGNGHAILNLRTTLCGKTTRTTYDGNMKEYDTSFAGLFSCLENAEVSNLKLLGVNIDIITENPCFAGAIAGYMDSSTISNCEVEGRVTITTTGKSFGTGGIVGFGSGRIESSKADVTLICVDKDVEDKDEQFMGGAYSNGYIDLTDNEIIIKGYDSDHGYVHDGGLVGMYIQYQEEEHYGEISGNTVEGFITFYEDNEDRRAYCEAYIGEILGWGFEYDDAFDSEYFNRDEIWFEDLLSESGYYEEDTDIDPADLILLPHTCENAQYDTTVVESTETTNGYTLYTCKTCDYSYKADYTVLKGTPTPEIPTEESIPEPEPVQPEQSGSLVKLIVIIAAIVVIILIIIIVSIVIKRIKKLH